MLLVDMLNKYLDREDIKQKNIAKKCGISEGTLSSFIKQRFDEPRIETVIKISRNLFPEYEKELVEEYIKSFELPKNLRLSMEYLEFNSNYEMLDYVIKKHDMINIKNNENKEWIKMYSSLLEYHDNPILLSNVLEEEHFGTIEMQSLKLILVIKGYFIKGDLNYFFSLPMSKILDSIYKIKDKFLVNYFLIRTNQYYGWVYLKFNKVVLARKCFEETINNTVNKKRIYGAYHGLGISYFFQDYSKSLDLLLLSKKYASLIGGKDDIDDIQRSINFLHCLWRKHHYVERTENIIQEDFHELALIEKFNGDVSKAKDILRKISIDKDKVNKLAFHFYYLGIVEDNIDFFYKSILYFKKSNDKFYIKLPCIELLRRGVDDLLVNALFGDELKGGEINENLGETITC